VSQRRAYRTDKALRGRALVPFPGRTAGAATPSPTLLVETIGTAEALESLESDWRHLERRAALELPFMTLSFERRRPLALAMGIAAPPQALS
jgi:hypothetical protein